jgi:hypothetical protein
MKDKNLRKALGMHGTPLCGCDFGLPGWQGEIPMLWRKIKELEDRLKCIERKKKKKKR